MTDVYLAYAREDRESVRLFSEMLQCEGWDVWMDPSDPSGGTSAAIDMKLGSAGAILVLWSGYSRHSEYVRSEAATGLYKNKLIQVSLDGLGAPSPFDQISVLQLRSWAGERDHPEWRRIMEAVRLYAGAPGSAGPLVQRRAVSGPSYLEPRRQVAWGPIIAVGLLVVGGAGIWMADPFGWRSTRTAVAGEAPRPAAGAGSAEAARGAVEATRVYEDSAASQQAWARIDRKNPVGLRGFIADFPNVPSAETAQSLLRVLDAQAWVDAVTADNESGYQSYLRTFPADGPSPGAMAVAATDRLGSLRVERTQSIEDIQKGLAALGLYRGEVDGRSGDGTVRAVRQFGTQNSRSVPAVATAAPRDLRALSEAIQRTIAGRPSTPTPSVTVAASTATAPAPSASAAAEADRQRIAQAQAAAQVAATQAARPAPDADSLAKTQLQRMVDSDDWARAQAANTVAGYQTYLAAHPSGAQASAARAAITALNRPAPHSIDLLPPDLKAAAEAARGAQSSANARAAAARDAATQAETAPGRASIVAAGGDSYDTQIASGAPNGYGTRVSGNPTNEGDRYRGQLRNGKSVGVGVYEFSDNPGNAGVGALRYEGEHQDDEVGGLGVTYWRNGDRFAGEAQAGGGSRGVLTFANGQRYEGELRNGERNGIGIVWSADGSVAMAGRWVNGELVEPVKVGE